MLLLVKNIRTNFQAFKVLVGINIKTTVLSTRLGWVWWILDPLIMMGIYYFLIKGIFNRGGDNYHVFVLSGIVSWQFFTRALTGTTNVIIRNKQIIRQIAFPLPVLIAIPIVTHFFFATIGMFIIMLFCYSVISVFTIGIVPLLFMIALLSYGMGLFVSVINVFIGDTRQLLSYVLRAGFFMTPILYPASRLLDSESISGTIKMILQLNPMMWVISAVRTVLIDGGMYDWQEYSLRLLVILLIIQAGLLWLRKNSSKIIKML